MTSGLACVSALTVYEDLRPHASALLHAVNRTDEDGSDEAAAKLRGLLSEVRTAAGEVDEEYLNELFVVDRYVDFLVVYRDLWRRIVDRQFSESWSVLQDGLDLLRTIKRFSGPSMAFFEDQLVELEKAYPYSVFASVGMLVDRFDCSVCGLDIDSDACSHRRGHLYLGVMAYGVAHQIVRCDHLSLTTMPDDKRCVVQYDDDCEAFKVVRLLAELIESKKCRPLDFSHLEHSVRTIPNPAYRHVGRNERCYCGSGKKFKKCCISGTELEQKHIDIVAVPRSIDQAIG